MSNLTRTELIERILANEPGRKGLAKMRKPELAALHAELEAQRAQRERGPVDEEIDGTSLAHRWLAIGQTVQQVRAEIARLEQVPAGTVEYQSTREFVTVLQGWLQQQQPEAAGDEIDGTAERMVAMICCGTRFTTVAETVEHECEASNEIDVASEAAYAEMAAEIDRAVEGILEQEEARFEQALSELVRVKVEAHPTARRTPAVIQMGRKLRWATIVGTVNRDTRYSQRHLLVVQLNGTHTRMLVEPAAVAV